MREKLRVNDADGRKPNYFEKNLSHCCVTFFPHKTHIEETNRASVWQDRY